MEMDGILSSNVGNKLGPHFQELCFVAMVPNGEMEHCSRTKQGSLHTVARFYLSHFDLSSGVFLKLFFKYILCILKTSFSSIKMRCKKKQQSQLNRNLKIANCQSYQAGRRRLEDAKGQTKVCKYLFIFSFGLFDFFLTFDQVIIKN
jgi:hypothetical protein